MSDEARQVMAGCVVLVTADRRATDLALALTRHGATVRQAPVISVVADADVAALIASTRRLIEDPPDVVIATTGVGFRGWIEAADSVGLAPELLATLGKAQIVARGPKANGAVRAAGLLADWVAESETAAEIAEVMLGAGVAGQHIAVQHHAAGSDGLDEAFLRAGARVTRLVVYRFGPPRDPELVEATLIEAARGDVDAVVFTSPPGAAAWVSAARRLGVLDEVVDRFADASMVAAAVGPLTAGPLHDVGIIALLPERGRLGALVRVLVNHYAEQEVHALVTGVGRLQLRRGAAVLNDRVLPLTPGSMEVLRTLVNARGGVVPRAAVLRALPGGSRNEHAAEVAIARLREATGEPTLIRTVVKRGYKLDIGTPG